MVLPCRSIEQRHKQVLPCMSTFHGSWTLEHYLSYARLPFQMGQLEVLHLVVFILMFIIW